MRTIDRYIAGMFLKNFLMGTVALTAILVFQAFLGEVFDGTHPVNQLIVFHFMNTPLVMVQLMPPAVLVATVFTLSALNRSSELVACYSLGISLRRIVGIMMTFVFCISCMVLTLQDAILPPLYKKKTTYYWHVMRKKPDFFLDFRRDKIWYRSKNLIYNIKTYDIKTKTIHGISVYTFDDRFKLVQLVEAEQAGFTPQGWKLLRGTVTLYPDGDAFPLMQRFEEKEFPIAEKPEDFQEIEKEVDGLRLRELSRYIDKVEESGADTRSYEVKFHSRISMSFIPLVMCLLGVPFSTRNRREGGVARDLGLCLLVTFFYWLFNSISLSLGTNGVFPSVIAAWLPSVVFATFASGFFVRSMK